MDDEPPGAHAVARGLQAAGLRIFSTTAGAVRCADGWYDVRALVRLAALFESRAELILP